MSTRTRVLIVGGGCAGAAAALALSATPALRRRFAVRIIERSWRLGGKGATGRDRSRGDLIEEHGLHVWMGFYERTFAAIRGVLEERGADAPRRLQTFGDAFAPRYAFSVWSPDAEHPWTLRLPSRPGRPGDGGPTPTLRTSDAAGLLASLARSVPRTAAGARFVRDLAHLGVALAKGGAVASMRGESLDDHDLRAWLRAHGASEAAVRSPLLRAFYDMTFAYPDGVSGPDRGAVAAGAAIRSMAKILLAYRGAPFWLLRHGMGDTAFAPAFEVLRRRGVAFSWMHTLEAVVPSADGAVAALEFSATPLPDNPMLLDLDGLQAWPSAPLVRPETSRSIRLERVHDFDLVILAVPAPALHDPLAAMALQHPHLRRALRTSASVGTRAAQVWSDASPRLAGITTGFGDGYPTAADLSEVLQSERWTGARRPTALTYLVDTTPDGDVNAANRAADRWVHAAGIASAERERYVRVNVEPADRYVLTLPGTVHERLTPEDDRIAGLRFAGDWTSTSINGGSVEAAFESGERAAASL